MRNRILSIVLCLALLLTAFPFAVPEVRAAEKGLTVTCGGEEITEISLTQEEKKTLTANAVGLDVFSYSWQILAEAEPELWVDIEDMTEESMDVSLATVKSVFDDAGNAYIRCAVECADGEVFSAPVRVSEEIPTEYVDPPHVTSFEVGLPTLVEEEKPMTFAAMRKTARAGNIQTVTITIQYLDHATMGGTEAAIYTPYTATIEKGGDFKDDITSPTFLGFAPYYDADNPIHGTDYTDDASKVVLNLTDVQEDVVIKVWYKAVEVPYAVKFFFQNINDDLYTERTDLYHQSEALTGTIIENDFLEGLAGHPEGFSKLYHIPESVAADGSTVFECYYDRNYYLIQFDLNGGYGVDPIYGRYGAPYIVNDPIRHGYIFQGWDLKKDTNDDGIADTYDNVVDVMPGTIPAANSYYRALWTNSETTYDVVYWLQNPNDDTDLTVSANGADLEYLGSCKVQTHIKGHLKEGQPVISGDIVHGENNLFTADHICGKTEHTHSVAAGCYNCGNASSSHTHDKTCLTCEIEEHTHDSACRFTGETKYIEFVTADKDVLVDGDGSSVVNVYYRYKEFTLKFYYAATKGGTETDKDRDPSTYDTIQIVGGTSYHFGYFGGKGPDTDDDKQQLDHMFITNSGQCGPIESLPTLNEKGQKRNYTFGTLGEASTSDYSYHYISFKARYGQNISELWPCDVFNYATRTTESNNTYEGVNWKSKYAFVSAWNGEDHVYYSRNIPGGNETIKGNYEKLDYWLLFDPKFETPNEVSYLCFWENGADINWSIPELYVYKIYVPVLVGEDLTGVETKVHKGVTYKLIDSYDTCDNSEVGQQTQPALEGYNKVEKTGESIEMSDEQKKMYARAFNVYLFYSRQENTLTFNNMNNVIKSETLVYETPLNDEFFIPDYPATLEENAFYFDGWYTSPGCFDGSKFDLTTETMPAYDLALYAKWSPETHTVNFYPTYNDMQSKTNCHYTKDVLHGQVVGTVDNPTNVGDGNMELIFAGWFYMDNGVKKAFSPLDMAVTESLDVFADWSSSMPQPYKISYVLQETPNTKVADDTTGFAYGGSTRTFVAKAGDPYNQLYPEYNTGYFPTVASHSITMQYEADKENPEHNVHTFYYVKAQDIKYTVNYINVDTGKIMKTEEYTTSKAVETVRFKAFPDMVPDAFYKRLVIAVEWSETEHKYVGSDSNVVNFYYSPNTTKAYYAVHYLREKIGATDDQLSQYKIDGSGGYELSTTHVEGIGDIGKNIDIVPQNIDGFELITAAGASKYTVGGENATAVELEDGKYSIPIRSEGTELYMFYKRKSYNYTVNYYLYNTTDKPINAPEYDPKSGSMKYGSTLTETAIPIPGFTCVSAQTTQSITIRDKEIQNVINFYYAPVEYVAEYIPVVNGEIPDDVAGWLNRSIEVVDGSDPFKGATPSTSEHYKFDGWYLDEACTVEIEDKATVDSVTNKLTPNKANLSETESNKFYAKFTRLAGDFTITRKNVADSNQVFVYQVRNTDTHEELFVTVQGNGSVTIAGLPYGNYAVTQLNGWSWRYGDTMVETKHDGGTGSTVTFDGGASDKWLSGSSNLEHNVKGG